MNSILLDHLQKLVNEGITIEEAVILLLEYEAKFDVIVALYKTQPFNFKIVIETLEIKGFVKIHTSPVYYEQNEQKINIPKNEPDCIYFTQKSKDIFDKFNKNVNIELLATKIREIYPGKIRTGGKLIRTNQKEVELKLKKFIKNYPNVTENEILTATTNYINAKKREQFAYTKTLGLFIYDDNESMLASEIENLSLMQNEEECPIHQML